MKHVRIFEDFSDTNEDSVYLALKGYLHCALWTEELDNEYDISDVDSLSAEQARDDVDKFLDELDDYDLLDELVSNMDYDSIGHDFWLSRNGHGAGFFDRGLEDVGDEIQKICGEFGNKSVYVENGNIYIE